MASPIAVLKQADPLDLEFMSIWLRAAKEGTQPELVADSETLDAVLPFLRALGVVTDESEAAAATGLESKSLRLTGPLEEALLAVHEARDARAAAVLEDAATALEGAFEGLAIKSAVPEVDLDTVCPFMNAAHLRRTGPSTKARLDFDEPDKAFEEGRTKKLGRSSQSPPTRAPGAS